MARTSRWAVLGVVVAAIGAVVVGGATPAAANHGVAWGAGNECAAAAMSTTTTVGTPVRFVVCTTIGSEPLAGHPMEVRVAGPNRTLTQSLTTDDAGQARFAVQPTAAGDTTVTLCDADGCVYGSTVITVTPATTTTTAAAAAPTTTVGESPTTTAGEAVPTAEDDDEDSGTPWIPIAIGLVVLLIVIGLLLRRRVLLTGGGTAKPQPYGPYISPEELARLRAEEERKRRRREQDEALPPRPVAPRPPTTGPPPPPAPPPSPPPVPTPDPGPTTTPGIVVDGGSTATATDDGPPVASVPPPEDYCDWTVLYQGPDGDIPLRRPTGYECCRFVLTVQSTVFKITPPAERVDSVLDWTMLGTDLGGGFSSLGVLTDVANGTPYAFGNLPVETTSTHGVFAEHVEGINLTSSARVFEQPGKTIEVKQPRTPGGGVGAIGLSHVQAAMEAAGIKQADVRYRRERPSMAAGGQHVEMTEIIVTRTTPCAPGDYVILAEGASDLERRATTLCSAPFHDDPCSTDLQASAGGRSDVSDDLEYVVDHREQDRTDVRSTPGSARFNVQFDPELKLKAELGGPFAEFEGTVSVSYDVTPATGHADPPMVDALSHRPKPEHASQATEPYLRICVLSVADVSALVTWGRQSTASAEATTTIRHVFEVEGKRAMNAPRPHDAGTCADCGRDTGDGAPPGGRRRQCRCNPRFTMDIGKGTAHGVITVDGNRFVLRRIPPSKPSIARWTLQPVVATNVAPAPAPGGTRTR